MGISAKEVAALRKDTGAGMMDAKKALEENDGDVDGARTWLREHGLTQAGKRAGRAADDGAVDVMVDGGVGALAELTCETDFVAKGSEFAEMLDEIVHAVAEHGDDGIDGRPLRDSTVGEVVKEAAGRLGENIGLGRVARFTSDDGLIDSYKHIQNERGTIGVLVELGGVDPSSGEARDVAHDIALHIASAAPGYVRRDDVPTEIVEAEREVLENLSRNEGKPEQALPKIVDGRMNGWYKERVLLDQAFVKEPKRSVGSLLEELGGDATVRRFVRVKIGEE
ncbi:MAG: translation elongation factor Ts [Acidimicrobiia bacterium]